MTTFGQRLDARARRTIARRAASPTVARLAAPVVSRAAMQAEGTARYRRVEAPVPPGPAVQRAPARTERGNPVPASARESLRPALGPIVDSLRLHDGPRADAVARRQGADAVAAGLDVHFRRGRLRLAEPAGLALLAHEATHALEASRPGAAWHRATTAGMLAEERRALSVERGVLTGGAAPPAAAPSAPAWTSPSSPAQAPAAAAVDRFEREDVPAAQPAPDLTQFRRDLHRELLLQIRTEFERGG